MGHLGNSSPRVSLEFFEVLPLGLAFLHPLVLAFFLSCHYLLAVCLMGRRWIWLNVHPVVRRHPAVRPVGRRDSIVRRPSPLCTAHRV